MKNRMIIALALLAMGNVAYGQDVYDPFGTNKKTEAPKATPKTETETKNDIYDPFGTAKKASTTATKTDFKDKGDPGMPSDELDREVSSYAAWGHSGGGYGYNRHTGYAGRTMGTSSYSHSTVGRTHIAGTHGGSYRTNGYHSGGSWAGYTPAHWAPYSSSYAPSYGTYSYTGSGYYPSTYAYSGGYTPYSSGYVPSYGTYSYTGSGSNTGGLPYSYAGAAYFWTEADGSVSRLDLQAYQQRMRYYCWYHGISYDDDRSVGSSAKTAPKNVVTNDGLTRNIGSAATVTPTAPVVVDDGLDRK